MSTYIVHWSANGLRQRERVRAHTTTEAQHVVMTRYALDWSDVYDVVIVAD